MGRSTRQRFGIAFIAISIGVTYATSTLADPSSPTAPLPPLPRVIATDDIAVNLLDNARQRLREGNREAAAALAHDAFELLAASERNGHHPRALSSDQLDLSTRR